MNESVLSLKEKNNTTLGFPTFKIPASTKKIFMIDSLNIILTSSVYGY